MGTVWSIILAKSKIPLRQFSLFWPKGNRAKVWTQQLFEKFISLIVFCLSTLLFCRLCLHFPFLLSFCFVLTCFFDPGHTNSLYPQCFSSFCKNSILSSHSHPWSYLYSLYSQMPSKRNILFWYGYPIRFLMPVPVIVKTPSKLVFSPLFVKNIIIIGNTTVRSLVRLLMTVPLVVIDANSSFKCDFSLNIY
jgi:hypothetical protein